MSLVSSSVSAAALLATYNINTSHPKNETSSQAINIGNLNQESELVSVSDQGTLAQNAVSSTFTAQDGSAVSLTQSFNNVVDQATTNFQLVDSQGDIIADNDGTDTQIAAYQQWLDGSLTLSAGTYTAIATPDEGIGGPGVNLSTQEQQGTTLQVSSSLTGSDPTEYYNFSLSGTNLKLDLNAGTQLNATRVQIYNSSGALIADSEGDPFQQAQYLNLTSNTGLTESSGNYQIAVSYANGVTTQPTVPYSFNLYTGSSYSVVYKNNVTAQPTDNSANGSVTATADAQLYSDNQFNKINATALSAINIGWIQQDKSALDVYSELTSADTADYYSLTLQQGNNLKFGFNSSTTPNPSNVRVQLYNSTGTQLLADSEGTAAQQAAYQALTNKNGYGASPGTYVVKISYAQGASKQTTPYEFNVYSGTSYSALYKTTASAQTIGNAIASGTYTGTSSAAAIASYLTAVSHDESDTSLSTALQALI